MKFSRSVFSSSSILLLSFCFLLVFFGQVAAVGNIRFIHAVALAPTVQQLILNGTVVAENIPFGGVTNFTHLHAGASPVSCVVVFGPGEQISIRVPLDNDYEVVGVGKYKVTASLRLMDFDFKAPSDRSQSSLRYINLISDSEPSELGLRLNAGSSIVIGKEEFEDSTDYVLVSPQKYSMELFKDKSTLTTTPVTLTTGKVYTVIAVGLLSGGPPANTTNNTTSQPSFLPQLMLIEDGDYRPAYIRFGHASPNTGLVDVTMKEANGNWIKAASNMTFTQTSPFVKVNDTQGLQVSMTPVKSASMVTTHNLEPTGTYALFMVGLSPQLSTVMVRDMFLDPTNTSALLRFVHLSPNTGPLTIAVGIADPVNLIYPETSQVFLVSTKKNVTVTISSGDKVVVEQHLKLNPAGSYLVLLEATADDQGVTFVLNETPSTNPPPPPSSDDDDHGLSGAAIAAIVIGTILGVILVVGIALYWQKSRRTLYEVIP